MAMSGRGWNDKLENYCDGYVLKISGSTATAVLGNSYLQPAAIFGISVTPGAVVTTGLVDIRDSSATGDNDPTIWSVVVAAPSASGQASSYIAMFTKGLVCNNGIVITATTVTGSISLLYKPRYPG